MPLELPPILPPPPAGLAFGAVSLAFIDVVPGDDAKGFAPAYHFHIMLADGHEAGHINFRVGDSDHVRRCAGHIGFAIAEPFRGHGYAFQACRALEPFVRTIYPVVVLTCDPENVASQRTIEKLGARFVERVPVPPDDPQYLRGSRTKLLYQWGCPEGGTAAQGA